ncbi:MAG: DNA (cytosine-5-)-methyltransferase [Erysipelotrichia bacterium]|nr:DNA (cytosine-5-)-methyltransferase [Erysipelotrichia bacterium]
MKVASLFAGIGGIDLAFEQLGHEVVWANEKDKFAAATYRKNFPNTRLIEDDINNIDASQVPDMDILTAGFPCQAFSVMGYQRGFKDPRGNLFFEVARIADEKQPAIILLENVRNLMNHDNGKTFMVIHNTLSELGYYIKYKVMSPHEYANIPQIRERIFIVAFKDLTMCDDFRFPEPVALTKSVNDIIDRTKPHHEIYYYTDKSKYYKLLNERIKDKEAIYRIDDWGIADKRWNICPTLKANMGTYPDRVPIIRDDFGIRKLTPHECLKLQGFPNSFDFPKIPLNEAYKQCGNTVAVNIIQNITFK